MPAGEPPERGPPEGGPPLPDAKLLSALSGPLPARVPNWPPLASALSACAPSAARSASAANVSRMSSCREAARRRA